MTISALPTPPLRSDPTNFAARADAFLAALPTFQSEANALAVAMNLNATTDTSTSSVLIGLGSKTFAVTAGKSFQPGMFLVVADTAAPSTNSMIGQVTSYSATTLVLNVAVIKGSGTKAAWVISQSVPVATTIDAIPIGVTTPAAGSFTALSATSNIHANNTFGVFFNGAGAYGSGVYSDTLGTTLRLNSGGNESMRLDASGNLGLGTVPSKGKLHVKQATEFSGIALESNYNTNEWAVVHDGSSSLRFSFNGGGANAGEKMRLDSAGNLSNTGSHTIGSYTLATRPSHAAGKIIFVTDGGAGAVFQGSNGSAWINLG